MRNIILGIVDQCDPKIGLIKYLWVSDLYFVVQWFCLIFWKSTVTVWCFDTLNNGADQGYSCPSEHLHTAASELDLYYSPRSLSLDCTLGIKDLRLILFSFIEMTKCWSELTLVWINVAEREVTAFTELIHIHGVKHKDMIISDALGYCFYYHKKTHIVGKNKLCVSSYLCSCQTFIWQSFGTVNDHLTHIRLASRFWDIGKQCGHRSDAAEHGVWSGSSLFTYRNFYQK